MMICRFSAIPMVSALLACVWFLADGHIRAAATGPAHRAEVRGWSIRNEAISVRVSQFENGRMAMSLASSQGKGRRWSPADNEIIRIDGVHEGRSFALTGSSAWRILAASRRQEGRAWTLTLRLRSQVAPIVATLRWRLEPGYAPLEFGYTLELPRDHAITQPVLITRADSISMTLLLDGSPAVLHWVEKGRADPTGLRLNQLRLERGGLQSLLCSPGKEREIQESVPWMAIQNGDGGWFMGWAFSAHGRFDVSRSSNQVSVRGGLEPGFFRHQLQGGEKFEVPSCLIGLYQATLDDGLADLHDFLRQHWMPASNDPRSPRVHYNTWYAFQREIDEKTVLTQMAAAHDLGAELFHLDAGWYRAVGDWRPNPRQFPHGLRFLADRAHRLGMQFGLWVAWSQVGPSLLREHPDWLVRRDVDLSTYRSEPLTSLTLCLGHRPCREWMKRELDRIVREYDLDYLEFDGSMIEVCRRADHTHQSGDGEYAATRGLYEVLDWLRARHPQVRIEDCSDGGHMLDYGLLRRTDVMSLTDLQYPFDNRRAVYGATFPFPAQACEAYMSYAPGDPLTQMRSAMMGLWSISEDVTRWRPDRRELCRREVERYKRDIRPLIREGHVRHVLRQVGGYAGWDGMAFESRDGSRGVLFAFQGSLDDPEGSVTLAGHMRKVEPHTAYLLRSPDEARERTLTGAQMMAEGIPFAFEGRRHSGVVSWDRAPEPAAVARPPDQARAGLSLGSPTPPGALLPIRAD
jgi:hypothetical protein